MSYHDLSECTLSNSERVAEKNKIVCRLIENDTEFTPTEELFISTIDTSDFVSVKQLFWLRDINNKY
jgi:hypothetical protein